MTNWREIATEGLPKENSIVLWYDLKGQYRVGRFYDTVVMLIRGMEGVKAFTHWMPLPKPPKKSYPSQGRLGE